MKSVPKYDADLHCHTSASDGESTPEEVVLLAAETGLKALAITDHDTVSGLEDAEKKARQLGIILVKGIEINTDGDGKEVHVLGLSMDEKKPYLKKKLVELQGKRIIRINEILEKLKKLRVDISYQEVLIYAKGESVGRPHVAQAMVKHGYVASFKEAFDRYLKIGSPAYVPRKKITPVLAIEIIREAGGVAVLAHPGDRILDSEIKLWINEGLQGIEVNHPDHSKQEIMKYTRITEKMKLIATGGSDYHGSGIKPGIKLGGWGVGLEVIDQIEKAKAK